MTLRIDGYSERGMINAICDDIIRSHDLTQLSTFLGWCTFPFQDKGAPDFSTLKSARILVEQGFSDFGDLDLLILLDHADRKQAVLLEAKVATDTDSPLRIDDQWNRFTAFLAGDTRHRSSLFVQIYRKLRLIERVGDLNRPLDHHPLWGRQSLGENRVVLKAAQLLSEYQANPWYVFIVPDDFSSVSRFFSTTLRDFTGNARDLPGWDSRRLGFLTWPSIHHNVLHDPDSARWQRSLGAFEWNEHQVYRPDHGDTSRVEIGTQVLFAGQRFVIVRLGKHSHRAIPLTTDATHFPKSVKIAVDELTVLTDRLGEISRYRPSRGVIYMWNPPSSERYQPPDRAPVPTPPVPVKVSEPGWETTGVTVVNTQGSEAGHEFHVYNHHLEREAVR